MIGLNCKFCGGDWIPGEPAATMATAGPLACGHCGALGTWPRGWDDRWVEWHNAAHRLRLLQRFDESLALWLSMIEAVGPMAEAHWGVVLARFGVEYARPADGGGWIMRCHRPNQASVLDDADFLQALAIAPDAETRAYYGDQARQLVRLQGEPSGTIPEAPLSFNTPDLQGTEVDLRTTLGIGWKYLEERDFVRARIQAERVLAEEPLHGEAFWLRVLAELRVPDIVSRNADIYLVYWLKALEEIRARHHEGVAWNATPRVPVEIVPSPAPGGLPASVGLAQCEAVAEDFGSPPPAWLSVDPAEGGPRPGPVASLLPGLEPAPNPVVSQEWVPVGPKATMPPPSDNVQKPRASPEVVAAEAQVQPIDRVRRRSHLGGVVAGALALMIVVGGALLYRGHRREVEAQGLLTAASSLQARVDRVRQQVDRSEGWVELTASATQVEALKSSLESEVALLAPKVAGNGSTTATLAFRMAQTAQAQASALQQRLEDRMQEALVRRLDQAFDELLRWSSTAMPQPSDHALAVHLKRGSDLLSGCRGLLDGLPTAIARPEVGEAAGRVQRCCQEVSDQVAEWRMISQWGWETPWVSGGRVRVGTVAVRWVAGADAPGSWLAPNPLGPTSAHPSDGGIAGVRGFFWPEMDALVNECEGWWSPLGIQDPAALCRALIQRHRDQGVLPRRWEWRMPSETECLEALEVDEGSNGGQVSSIGGVVLGGLGLSDRANRPVLTRLP
jgi:hypothetical protein